MEYASLIAAFGENYSLEEFKLDEDGATGFLADGRIVTLRLIPETETVAATVDLGAVATAGEAVVNRLLVKANAALFLQDGMALVVNATSGHYNLLTRFEIAAMDFPAFDAAMARLLGRADQWGELLEKFIPLAAEAEAKGADEPEAPEAFLPGGDAMRV